MRVLKFGGTSIGSADRIRHVVNLISENTPKVVVFSAISGVTNLLSELIKYAKSNNKNKIKQIINQIQSTHNNVITELINDAKSLEVLDNKLRDSISLLNKLVSKSNISKYENQILAQGELLSANIIFYYTITKNPDTVLIPATEYMRTNKCGEPDYKEISKRLNKKLDNFKSANLIITNGYICKNNKGKIDNLGRGGSDYSATIIGNVINAKEIQIWTDIEGIHNNDPRFVKNTTTVSQMSYTEASELAFFGAKVLHPLSIIPAQIKNIPVIIKNTLKPYMPGTIITNKSNNCGVMAISAKDDITTIKVKSARMVNAYGFLRKIFEIFEKCQTSIDMLTTSETSVAMTIDNTKNLNAINKELKSIGEIEIVDNQSIICLVGGYENERNEILKDIIDGFGDTKIRMISYGASKVNVSFTVNACDKELVLNTLHKKTFETKLCSALN